MGSTLWSAADMGTFPRRRRIKRFGPDHNTTDTLLLGITLRGTGKDDALGRNFFRDLNAQLTGLFFHDPLAIQRHQK